jgi:hypothetical protein
MTNGEPAALFAWDPFGPAANPKAYVPRTATERALRSIEASLAAERTPALIGPPGFGKSLLLHRVRLGQPLLRSLYIPFCTLPIDELGSFALRLFGEPAAGDPVDALLAHARALGREGSGILLLIDDAGAMPVETAAGLADLMVRSEGALRVALAAIEDSAARRVCAAFGSTLDEIRLDEVLDEEEVRQYVATRLAFAEADALLCAAFDVQTVARLHRLSEGVPRRLNIAAQDIVRDTLEANRPELAEAAREAEPLEEVAPAAMRSVIAAMLAQEPDVRAVVELLRSGDAPAAEQTPFEAPDDAPARVATAPIGGVAAEREPAEAAVAPQNADASAAPAASEGRESHVGTYRMLRSAAPETARREKIRPEPASLDASEGDPSVDAVESGAPSAQIVDGALLAQSAAAGARSERSARPAAQRRSAGRGQTRRHVRHHVLDGLRGALRGALVAIGGAAVIGVAAAFLWFAEQHIETFGATRAPGAAETTPAPPADAQRAPEQTAPALPAQLGEPAPRAPLAGREAPVARELASPPATAASGGAPASPAQRSDAPENRPGAPPPAPAPAKPVIVRVGINATPWAAIEVDGVEVGETPLAGIGIPEGTHTFRARMPDGSVREREVEIDSEHRRVVFE